MQAKQEFYYVHVTVLSGRECRCESENREKKVKGALSSETDAQSQC